MFTQDLVYIHDARHACWLRQFCLIAIETEKDSEW
jgi:hypothetical protein